MVRCFISHGTDMTFDAVDTRQWFSSPSLLCTVAQDFTQPHVTEHIAKGQFPPWQKFKQIVLLKIYVTTNRQQLGCIFNQIDSAVHDSLAMCLTTALVGQQRRDSPSMESGCIISHGMELNSFSH